MNAPAQPQRLEHFPVSFFASVMGTTGLALAWALYPVDIRLGSSAALSLNALRFGVVLGADAGTYYEFGPELALLYAP